MSQNAYSCWERKAAALRPDQIEKLAEILGVSVDALFNGNGGTDRKGGPTGKARRVFEEVSRLPLKRQQRLVSVVEDMLAAQRLTANG